MSVRKLALKAALMTSIVAMPTLVHAADASKLSVGTATAARAGADQQDGSSLGGGVIIPLLALAAIVAGILVVLDNDDDPDSP
ncbi:MAG TPA: hypothetical protein VGD10_01000 [Allosphingosinicella sp.]|uniref:hypothetical protein n=1 Tax=Allosphingosinicella sp. TaxID=2823234 RepID=UPI002EDAA1AA